VTLGAQRPHACTQRCGLRSPMAPPFSKPTSHIQVCGSRRSHGSNSSPSTSRSQDLPFEMMVIPMEELLQMPKLYEYSEAMSKGVLRRWDKSMKDRVVFVSHQWLGYHEPDPQNEQFQVLKRILEKLIAGQVSVDELSMAYKCYFMQNSIRKGQWKAHLPSMYVWIDYCCMPQVRQNSPVEVAESAGKALCSLPAYVERCWLMLVLVPVCEHKEARAVCNYATWRSRGWCRAELMFALLARKSLKVMVCTGSDSVPFLLAPSCALRLPAGEGNFTCCQLGHVLNGKQVECDKATVGATLQAMITQKVMRMREVGNSIEERYFLVSQRGILRHLPTDGASALRLDHSPEGRQALARAQQKVVAQLFHEVRQKGTLRSLRAMLNWKPEDDEPGRRTGYTLLFWAAMAGCTGAIQELFANGQATRQDLELPLKQGIFHVDGFLKGAKPLMGAMAYGRFDSVEALLSMNANPMVTCAHGVNPLMVACMTGNAGNVEGWLRRFPSYDLEQRDKTWGDTALSNAAFSCPSGGHICKLLIAAGAKVNYCGGDGGSLLHKATLKEDSDPELVKVLLDAGCDVNFRSEPQSLKWRAILNIAGKGARAMPFCPTLREVSQWHRTTPLHHAARRGDTAMVKVLLDHGAVHVRDGMGRRPIDSAATKFGSVPDPVRVALDGTSLEQGTGESDAVRRIGGPHAPRSGDRLIDYPDSLAASAKPSSDKRGSEGVAGAEAVWWGVFSAGSSASRANLVVSV